MPTIGVQAMMLKAIVAEEGPFEAMRRLVEVGFSVTEISQIPITKENVHELARAREELGITFAAISAFLTDDFGGSDALATDLDKIVGDAKTLGTSMVRMAMMPLEATRDKDLLLDFCKEAERMAKRLEDSGIELIYHNHHLEFAKFDGQLVLDISAEGAPSMGLELDVHWVQRGGLDPERAIRSRGNRVRLLHLKDYRIEPLPASAVEAARRGDVSAFDTGFQNAVVDAAVGDGNLDWDGIIAASQDVGVPYMLIELEHLDPREVLDALRVSRKNLVSLGYERLL